MSSQPNLTPGIAPIFGKDLCCFISGERHITLQIHDFGSQLFGGFSLGIDLQPETTQPSVLLGTGVPAKTSLVIHYNADGVKNRIRLDLSDDNGRMLSASAQLSTYAAKRLFMIVDVERNNVQFYEFNLPSAAHHPTTQYIKRESPQLFSRFAHELILGGACIDGKRCGEISAKVGHFITSNRSVSEAEIDAFYAVSRRDVEKFNGNALYAVDESLERRAIFRDDMRKLRDWMQKPYLSGADTRDAASMLYRWLLDKQPMLQDLCNELGIQLTLPGTNERTQNQNEIFKSGEWSMLAMTLGKRSLLGYQWVTRERFVRDVVMIIEGTQIRVDAFVKFVRNKLGGGHLDARDRRKWQRQLGEMSRYWKRDSDFLNHHMKEVLIAVWEGVWENRIEQHVDERWSGASVDCRESL